MAGYTIKTLEDVPDVLGDYPGEMRMLDLRARHRAGRAHLPADAAAHRRQGLLRPLPPRAGGDLLRRLAGSCSSSSATTWSRSGPGTAIRVAPEVVALRLERRARGCGARDRLPAHRRPARRRRTRAGLLARLGRAGGHRVSWCGARGDRAAAAARRAASRSAPGRRTSGIRNPTASWFPSRSSILMSKILAAR